MATFDYPRLRITAKNLINKFGQSGAIKRTTPPDPIFGGDPTVTSYPAKLVPMTYDQRYIDGTNILTSDRQIYISAVELAIEPQVGDIATAGGVDFHIVNMDPYNFDGIVNVVFVCQGRVAS